MMLYVFMMKTLSTKPASFYCKFDRILQCTCLSLLHLITSRITYKAKQTTFHILSYCLFCISVSDTKTYQNKAGSLTL